MTRNRKPVLVGYEEFTIAVGALAARTAILMTPSRAWDVKVRLPSLDFWLIGKGFTANEVNKLVWGIADATMTTGEIGECLQSAPTFKGDIPAAERARRPARILGKVLDPAVGAAPTEFGNQGHAKVGLTLAEPIGYNLFVYNSDQAVNMTTGGTIEVLVKEYAIDVE